LIRPYETSSGRIGSSEKEDIGGNSIVLFEVDEISYFEVRRRSRFEGSGL
jgi:hypothetical protein